MRIVRIYFRGTRYIHVIGKEEIISYLNITSFQFTCIQEFFWPDSPLISLFFCVRSVWQSCITKFIWLLLKTLIIGMKHHIIIFKWIFQLYSIYHLLSHKRRDDTVNSIIYSINAKIATIILTWTRDKQSSARSFVNWNYLQLSSPISSLTQRYSIDANIRQTRLYRSIGEMKINTLGRRNIWGRAHKRKTKKDEKDTSANCWMYYIYTRNGFSFSLSVMLYRFRERDRYPCHYRRRLKISFSERSRESFSIVYMYIYSLCGSFTAHFMPDIRIFIDLSRCVINSWLLDRIYFSCRNFVILMLLIQKYCFSV